MNVECINYESHSDHVNSVSIPCVLQNRQHLFANFLKERKKRKKRITTLNIRLFLRRNSSRRLEYYSLEQERGGIFIHRRPIPINPFVPPSCPLPRDRYYNNHHSNETSIIYGGSVRGVREIVRIPLSPDEELVCDRIGGVTRGSVLETPCLWQGKDNTGLGGTSNGTSTDWLAHSIRPQDRLVRHRAILKIDQLLAKPRIDRGRRCHRVSISLRRRAQKRMSRPRVHVSEHPAYTHAPPIVLTHSLLSILLLLFLIFFPRIKSNSLSSRTLVAKKCHGECVFTKGRPFHTAGTCA